MRHISTMTKGAKDLGYQVESSHIVLEFFVWRLLHCCLYDLVALRRNVRYRQNSFMLWLEFLTPSPGISTMEDFFGNLLLCNNIATNL